MSSTLHLATLDQFSLIQQNLTDLNWVKDGIFYQIFPDRFARREVTNRARFNEIEIQLESWDSPPTLSGFKVNQNQPLFSKLFVSKKDSILLQIEKRSRQIFSILPQILVVAIAPYKALYKQICISSRTLGLETVSP